MNTPKNMNRKVGFIDSLDANENRQKADPPNEAKVPAPHLERWI